MQAYAIPHVVEVHIIRGAASEGDPDLLIEVPHGATAREDFEELAGRMEGPLPDGLIDFFFVNTDVGAFELGEAAARRLVEAAPTRCVALVRSRVPRTFVDCNRQIELDASAFQAGRVTPGLMPWVQRAADQALVRGRYAAYMQTANEALASLRPGGAVLLLHTYAPREVGVEVGPDIVERLRWAYQADVVERWPLRPELDVICRDQEGRDWSPAAPLEVLEEGVRPWGWRLGRGATYPLHPSTVGWSRVVERPGRALCLEVRRDLLAAPFAPFEAMRIGEAKVAALAEVLASALAAWG